MKIIIVIGNIASGKSSVVELLSSYLDDAKIIDLDKIGHQILEGNKIKRQLKVLFGEFNNNKELAYMAFKNKECATKLNNIMHRYIYQEYKVLLEKYESENFSYVITEETAYCGGKDPFVQCSDVCVCVSSNKDLLESRAIKRGMNKLDFQNRLNVQVSQTQMEKAADYIIYNNGDRLNLEDQCKHLAKILTCK